LIRMTFKKKKYVFGQNIKAGHYPYQGGKRKHWQEGEKRKKRHKSLDHKEKRDGTKGPNLKQQESEGVKPTTELLRITDTSRKRDDPPQKKKPPVKTRKEEEKEASDFWETFVGTTT